MNWATRRSEFGEAADEVPMCQRAKIGGSELLPANGVKRFRDTKLRLDVADDASTLGEGNEYGQLEHSLQQFEVVIGTEVAEHARKQRAGRWRTPMVESACSRGCKDSSRRAGQHLLQEEQSTTTGRAEEVGRRVAGSSRRWEEENCKLSSPGRYHYRNAALTGRDGAVCEQFIPINQTSMSPTDATTKSGLLQPTETSNVELWRSTERSNGATTNGDLQCRVTVRRERGLP
ncbi:hypothetical protein BHE74_00008161 [Ensete ventricosum]|nr:hypothetical protein GW17_00003024 [Ensete ventricosum]RWW83338.1 hypothetical protein BHE74_00008161 [Ensete ventricosum]RZR89836.1 hypothetical protein BHM03_00017630 [Ensete ventricosum]